MHGPTSLDPEMSGKGFDLADGLRPGRQDPLLVVRLTAAGEFKARVSSSDAKSAGVYNLKVRRFIFDPLTAGERKTGSFDKTGTHWYRLTTEAGRTIVVTARSASFKPFVSVLFPNGEEAALTTAGVEQAFFTRSIFKAPTAGDCYVRIAHPNPGNGQARETFSLTASDARSFPLTIGAVASAQTLPTGGLDL